MSKTELARAHNLLSAEEHARAAAQAREPAMLAACATIVWSWVTSGEADRVRQLLRAEDLRSAWLVESPRGEHVTLQANAAELVKTKKIHFMVPPKLDVMRSQADLRRVLDRSTLESLARAVRAKQMLPLIEAGLLGQYIDRFGRERVRQLVGTVRGEAEDAEETDE